MSWFQVASSYHSLGRWPEAVEAYQKVLVLDPHYAVAMFDLGVPTGTAVTPRRRRRSGGPR
jgi:tetratricopeptide (TPR) repeat protein